jgi:hypothetical protein
LKIVAANDANMPLVGRTFQRGKDWQAKFGISNPAEYHRKEMISVTSNAATGCVIWFRELMPLTPVSGFSDGGNVHHYWHRVAIKRDCASSR